MFAAVASASSDVSGSAESAPGDGPADTFSLRTRLRVFLSISWNEIGRVVLVAG